MRLTIRLPDDILERVTLDALKRRRNSKEVVITEILRAHYGGARMPERFKEVLAWRIPAEVDRRIQTFRKRVKENWK